MKTNKIFAGMLVALGFGSAVGLGSGCAHRGSKSKGGEAADNRPVADSTTVREGGDVPIRVMYGVPPAYFEPVRRVMEVKDAEKITVSGTITDAGSGEPIIGATVISGSSGALSAMGGRYSIVAAIGDTLRFAYLGYAIQAIEIERDTLDVRLKSLSIYDIGVRVLTAYGPPPASFDVYKPVPKISDVTQPARLRRQQYEPPKLQNK